MCREVVFQDDLDRVAEKVGFSFSGSQSFLRRREKGQSPSLCRHNLLSKILGRVEEKASSSRVPLSMKPGGRVTWQTRGLNKVFAVYLIR